MDVLLCEFDRPVLTLTSLQLRSLERKALRKAFAKLIFLPLQKQSQDSIILQDIRLHGSIV